MNPGEKTEPSDKVMIVVEGDGFEYLGVELPVGKIPKFWRRGEKIAAVHGFDGPGHTIRNIGCGHTVIFAMEYPSNRADKITMEQSHQAL